MSQQKEIQYREIDIIFADFIHRLAGENAFPELKETALKLSYAIGRGASCIQITDSGLREKLLKCSAVVGCWPQDALTTPLLLDGDLLYFQKL